MASLSSDSLGIGSIFVISVGLAIWSANYMPAKAPPVTQRVSVPAPTLNSAENQTAVTAPTWEAPKSNTRDKLLIPRTRNAPPGFGDLFWGNPPSTVMIRVGGPSGPDKVSVWRSPAIRTRLVFGVPVTQESYFFRNDALFAGEMFFSGPDSFQGIKDEITKVFGLPDFVDEASKVFEWDWNNPDIHLRLSYKEALRRSEMHLERM